MEDHLALQSCFPSPIHRKNIVKQKRRIELSDSFWRSIFSNVRNKSDEGNFDCPLLSKGSTYSQVWIIGIPSGPLYNN